MDWTAASVSLRLAFATTAILSVTGIPLAYVLSRTQSRLRPLFEALLTLPLVLPPTVIGFYLLLMLAPGTAVGRVLAGLGLTQIPFTFGGILVGAVLVNLPFALRPFVAAFDAVDRRLDEAAWCLGASGTSTFRRVTLPLAAPGVAAGIALTFAHSLGEFGVVLMLGGNIPGVTRTLSVAIYDDVQALDYSAAGRTSFALVAFAVVTLALVSWLSRRRGSR